ncbi:hypothetical protein FDA94_18495 [Herbidospora galbida]|uniref:Uncharacterized protein n=1 Tax=Herbidospora galbida TaxID=2575442 RepID=A0A4U3MGN8_9ACTN|nr:hypothetical protein [Herbidospora galbida]TKK87117.1 hypothetical protein FDA94_18495 [Herbidospora galbida]
MSEILEAADRLCAAIRAHAEAVSQTPPVSTAVVPAGYEVADLAIAYGDLVADQTGWSSPLWHLTHGGFTVDDPVEIATETEGPEPPTVILATEILRLFDTATLVDLARRRFGREVDDAVGALELFAAEKNVELCFHPEEVG